MLEGFYSLLDAIAYHEAKELFTTALQKAMERMARRIATSPVVLPLTAGCDSRLMALALKEQGITPLYTCTYGQQPGIHEVQRAKVIAEKLRFEHRFFSTIPEGYSSSSYTHDAEALAYLRYISGLGTGYFFAEYTTTRATAQLCPLPHRQAALRRDLYRAIPQCRDRLRQ